MVGPMKLVENILEHLLTKLDDSTVGSFLNGLTNKLFLQQAKHRGVSTNPADFVTLFLQGMTQLESGGKANLIYKFSQCVGGSKEGNKKESPLPMNRMPFGPIDYTIQFFTCTDVRQACTMFITFLKTWLLGIRQSNRTVFHMYWCAAGKERFFHCLHVAYRLLYFQDHLFL